MSAAESCLVMRRDAACADSSLITQLINDKFIKGLAHVLSVDEKIVGMAEKLFEGVKSEHGTLDLDAWIFFSSLPIFWRNDELIKECQTKMFPDQKYLNQQMHEMSDDPLLKPLFAEKEHIRVVLILLFLSLDVSPTSDGTDSCASEDFEDDFGEEGCCVFDKSFDIDQLKISLPSEHMMETLANNLMEDEKIVKIFRELLGTVDPSCSPLGALEHFEKVKEVWGNQRFIDHLLKSEYDVRPCDGRKSKLGLSIKIRSLIEEDPFFEVISNYDDPGFRMRVALSILIGFWSNQDIIRSLVKTMGCGEKKEKSGEGKEESPRDWMSNPPNIMELYREKSIWELAEQLKAERFAVIAADFYLKTLGLNDCYCSYEQHFEAASFFWHQPSIILKFNEAMKKDSNLVEILTKYSKGAETLRVQERLFLIRNNFQLDLLAIDSFDSHSEMRLALKILFGYWVDRDMTHLFLSVREAKKTIGEAFRLSENEEKMEAFHYYASCATDVEGLKNWLSNKYGNGSDKALSLTKKIGDYQKDECVEASNTDGPICVQLVLSEACIVTFALFWFRNGKHRMNFRLPL